MSHGRLTSRDVQLAQWVARWQPVTALQLGLRFGMSRRVAYRRVEALREQRYLRTDRPVHELPGVLVLTGRGAELTDGRVLTTLPAPHALWRHLAAVDAAALLEAHGRVLLSQRELASHPALQRRLPHAGRGALLPEALALDPDLAIYAAVSTNGHLDHTAHERLDELAAALRPAGLGVEVLVAAGAEGPVRDALADSADDVELRSVDLEGIGRPER